MAAPPSRENLAVREAEIKALVEQDKREEAGKMLFEVIVSCAQSGDLKNANRLRDWLYDVNPMALSDIIKANEIIEETLSGSIDEQFLRTWDGLKQVLSEEEFTSLYHCLEEHRLDAEKQVVKIGSRLDAIFLVTAGNLRVSCQCGGKNVQIKVLEPGMMIGENCFAPSCWTVSLASASPVTLKVLRHAQLRELCDRFPGFEAKLTGYYEKFNDISRLLKEQGLNRRLFQRFTVDRRITFQVIDKNGRIQERAYRGELDSISRGGLAFILRIVNRENRRMLFGRRLLVSVQNEEKKLEFSGTVVAIAIHDFQEHDYAVHVAFDNQAAENVIASLTLPEEKEEPLIPVEIPEIENSENEEQ
ncbi:MAG: cyclic nucleotide-binding domain-containing protein [Desulfobulbaceae bacterium]|nr:cyclic nucleotide-binding domain-containing protein [Desulfobulbaceae bacterium]